MAETAQNEKTYYFVTEKSTKYEKTGEGEPLRTYLTANPKPLFQQHGAHFPHMEPEEWVEEFINNEFAQRIAGVAVRVATEQDLEDFADELEVIEAVESYRDADNEAKRIKIRAQITASKWFSENVRDQEAVKSFFQTYRLNPFNFASWITTAEERSEKITGEPFTASSESLSTMFDYWSNKNKKLKGDQKTKALNSDAYKKLAERVGKK